MRDMGTVCQSCGLEEACTGFILFPVEMGRCPCFQREDKQMLCAWDLPFIWDSVCKIIGAQLINTAFQFTLGTAESAHADLHVTLQSPGAELRPF